MNNDNLIDQARHLYATLHVECSLSIQNKTRFDRLGQMVTHAYCRYLRRLNRCAVCYQHRAHSCIREFWVNDRKPCPKSNNHLSLQ